MSDSYPEDGELVVHIGDQIVSGWESIRLSRGIERTPSVFDLAATEKNPGDDAQVDFEPGQVAQVMIGADLVLTGYADRFGPSFSASSHEVRLVGRSAVCDLTDSMAWLPPNGVLNGTSVLAVVTAIAAAYGVKVTFLADQDVPIPQLVVTLGETGWDVIERVTRYGAMLCYDDPTGNLVLSQAGTSSMASGIVQGLNVLSADVAFDLQNRFTEYHAYMVSTAALSDYGTGVNGNQLGVVTDPGMVPLARPDGQARVRRMAVITEQADINGPIALRRARWEMARRYGRSQVVRAVVDSWRDRSGALWTPNMLLPVQLPALKLTDVTYIIAEVDYIRDRNGTSAVITAMPPEAFQPEPVILTNFDWQLQQDLSNGNAGAPALTPSSDSGAG